MQNDELDQLLTTETIKSGAAMGNTTPPPPSVFRGSCFCGLITYASSTLPISITLCHCIPCRKLSGAPFMSFCLLPNSALCWTSPKSKEEPDIKLTSSAIAVRGSCKNCGTPLFMKYHCRPDDTSVNMGSVDESSVVGDIVRPKQHIFLGQKAGWWEVRPDDGLEHHEWFSESFQRLLKEWEVRGRERRVDVEGAQA